MKKYNNKEIDSKYAVVNKEKRKLITICNTAQEAWSKWQDQWMNQSNEVFNEYTYGKFKNMKKYLIKD